MERRSAFNFNFTQFYFANTLAEVVHMPIIEAEKSFYFNWRKSNKPGFFNSNFKNRLDIKRPYFALMIGYKFVT
mgnify:CR=1 FL=1